MSSARTSPQTTPDDDGGPAEHRLTEEQAADLLINWELAVHAAGRLASPGPRLRASEAAEEVAALRRAAADAVGHVHRITGLAAAEDLGADDTLVVDRPTWARANAESFRLLLGPAMKAAVESRPELRKRLDRRGPEVQVFGSAVTGTELGGILAFLSSHVLGQFDPFTQNRLMLVAPNIVEVRRELNVVAEDFRLWVCLHEQTHRVQFAAAPWLAEHLQKKIAELSSSMMSQTDGLPERLADAARQLKEELVGRRDDEDSEEEPGPTSGPGDQGGAQAGEDSGELSGEQGEGAPQRQGSAVVPRNRLLEAIQSPEDRERMSHLTAVMSLLEGHANVVMDAVDASVVPTVKTIRRRFEDRGKHRSVLERWIRRVLQLDAKARQYRDGQKFVGHIVEAVGMEQFNRIWDSPEHLPTEQEIHDPDAWIRRVLG